MNNQISNQIPVIQVSSEEFALLRKRVSHRVAISAVFAFLLFALGPAFLKTIAPVGLSAAELLWWAVVSAAAAVSSFELWLSENWVSGAVLLICCAATLLVLEVNLALTCAELRVNTKLNSTEKFEVARKGFLVLRRLSVGLGWAWATMFVIGLVSLVYKMSVFEGFEPSEAATITAIGLPILVLLSMVSPIFSFLIPRSLREPVDSPENSESVRLALDACGDQYWSENRVSFYSYSSILFYWLAIQEGKFKEWALVAGGGEIREKIKKDMTTSFA